MGLIIFCWGDDNNCLDTIKFLKEKGLHAIIYDKVDLLLESKVSTLLSFLSSSIESSKSLIIVHFNCIDPIPQTFFFFHMTSLLIVCF